ncbi:uncharacterized protein LOC113465250 [Ceratina calcarata]|uniref:Uncharacterized protein LOC113465250 n=1 Tax=Ceratina calcarata TaxID=156304 RepID=A0AAJ7SCH8_9HYME|nr:uncharacterized protein LOC113465250 [Ceratina calcarata]
MFFHSVPQMNSADRYLLSDIPSSLTAERISCHCVNTYSSLDSPNLCSVNDRVKESPVDDTTYRQKTKLESSIAIHEEETDPCISSVGRYRTKSVHILGHVIESHYFYYV